MESTITGGGKKPLWYGISTGDSGKPDKRTDSSWNAGKKGPHRRIRKGHVPRLDPRKCISRAGSGGTGSSAS